MNLGMVFTQGVSVADWDRLGLLDRELQPYAALLRDGGAARVLWFTYGPDDRRFAGRLAGIEVVPMPRAFDSKPGRLLYSLLMPWVRAGEFRSLDVVKTNQMKGSWTGVLAALAFGKRLIVRTGFTWSRGLRRSPLDWLAPLCERLAFNRAQLVLVTDPEQARYVSGRYRLPSDRVQVLPNFVDTSLFRPQDGSVREDRLVFVGRLSEEKNLESLIRALSGLGVGLDLYYGDDARRQSLEAVARETGVDVRFFGRVPNADLPAVLRRYSLFVLPSLYEGMPKSLLEAMACGLCVLATDVRGTRELVEHGRTGWLVGTTPAELRAGVQTLRGDAALRERLGRAAAEDARRRFSLDAVTTLEKSLLEAVG